MSKIAGQIGVDEPRKPRRKLTESDRRGALIAKIGRARALLGRLERRLVVMDKLIAIKAEAEARRKAALAEEAAK